MLPVSYKTHPIITKRRGGGKEKENNTLSTIIRSPLFDIIHGESFIIRRSCIFCSSKQNLSFTFFLGRLSFVFLVFHHKTFFTLPLLLFAMHNPLSLSLPLASSVHTHISQTNKKCFSSKQKSEFWQFYSKTEFQQKTFGIFSFKIVYARTESTPVTKIDISQKCENI